VFGANSGAKKNEANHRGLSVDKRVPWTRRRPPLPRLRSSSPISRATALS